MLGVAANPLPGTGGPFYYRIDRFEVARICRQSDFNLRAGGEFSNRPIAEMIFYVAIAGDRFRNVVLTEFGEDHAERFFQKVREHVEAAAMRHAHADFFNADRRTLVQDAVENHHQRFRALKRKAFLTDVSRMQKTFERFGFHQSAQNPDFHVARRRMLVRP